MMPPADTAISIPDMPNGANPCIVKLSGLKNENSTPITSKGTMNLKMLIKLLDLAKVLTLE